MEFHTFEAKETARTRMRQTHPNPLLVTLLYLLLAVVLQNFVLSMIWTPFDDVFHYLMIGYDWDTIFEYVIRKNLREVAIFLVLDLLFSLYNVLLRYGYTSYALRLSRNEQPSFPNLMDGFARPIRTLLAAFWEMLFTDLWTLLGMLPGAGILILGSFLDAWGLMMIGYWLMLAGTLAALFLASYRYRLTSYFLLDNPACTALEAIQQSKRAMKGRTWELFFVDINFLGWAILGVLTFGVLYVWLVPYRCATEALFYDFATAGSQRQRGSYAGPDYEPFPPGPRDGPEPF